MSGNYKAAFEKMELDRAERHLFLCTGPDCCSGEEGAVVWKAMKAGLKANRLPILRSKAACLRVCRGGPWLLVYPEGIWYGSMTPERFSVILERHLIGGEPVEAWVEARHPLPG
ncbi:MAG: hypothetical protein R3F07_15390 [Opitutaceae bacterium]